MRINHKVLSIPPYISTSWKNIISLKSSQTGDKTSLTIHLQDGSCIQVPEIDPEIVKIIFTSHAKHIEQETPVKPPIENHPISTRPFLELDTIQAMLHHKEEERNSPNLPTYLLNKVSQLSEEIGISDFQTLPNPEPDCNCPHCQIAKSIRETLSNLPEFFDENQEEEEEVSEADLTFKAWIIQPLSGNLYKVIHPDELQKEYQVFLESPIECSCGSNQCEHIQAVLNT